MATTREKFDSVGGFSIDKTVVVDELRNAKDLNTLEIKNSFYSDSKITNYILRGLNTSVLQLDDVGTQITIDNNTLNFITGRIICANPLGTVLSLGWMHSRPEWTQKLPRRNLRPKISL